MQALRKKVISSSFLFILSLSILISPAQAYFFATDLETQVLTLDEKNIELIVTKKDDIEEAEAFPVGTILKGKFYEYSFNKHFLRDEYIKIHLYEAKLPDGSLVDVDNDIKIKPRVFFSSAHGIQFAGAAVGTALKVTVGVWSVGFPVGRGVKAVTEAAYAVYNTPIKESKWEQGSKGFVKGALFPLPELVMKGEDLPIHDESYIWIQDAKEEKQNLTAFIVKRKNIYLDKEKYYADKGVAAPDFTNFLREKDYTKYQKKLAKKGVNAKIKDRQEIDEENLVKQSQKPKEEISSSNQITEESTYLSDNHKAYEASWRRPKVQFQEINR